MTLQLDGEHTSGPAAGCFVYDVFVLHADAAADEAFVNGYLLPKLGLAPERVLRRQTLELGRFLTEEIERGVRSSRVTIVVLSAAYMDDHWAAFGEQLAAYASMAKDVHGVLLPLLREDCKLTMYVQSLVKLDFRDPSRTTWEAEIDRLRAYLARPAAAGADLPCPYPGMRPFTGGTDDIDLALPLAQPVDDVVELDLAAEEPADVIFGERSHARIGARQVRSRCRGSIEVCTQPIDLGIPQRP